MESSIRTVLAFGPFRLIPDQRLILQEDSPLRLGSRAREILFALVERAGEMIKKHDLIARVWPGVLVEEATLRVHISALRKALCEQAGHRYIENVNGLGYRFVGRIEHLAAPNAATSSNAAQHSRALTRMIGRAQALETVVTRLNERPLLTIVGPGGIGKTTLARAAMRQLLDNYPDGIRFVDFAAISDPRMVPATLAATLGAPITTSDPSLDSTAWLANKQMLIVLDNCEHVIHATASLAESLLNAAPQLRLLVTSREPLRAEGEFVLRLPALDVPPAGTALTVHDVEKYSAIRLFMECAPAIRDSVKDSDVVAIADICRRVDGLPLAIELAASQAELLGLRGLLSHKDDLLDLLTQGRRTAVQRQQTLRACVEWSFNLLSDSERTALGKLSEFSDGFDIEAARSTIVDMQTGSADVLDMVSRLTAKSMLVTDGEDGLRFRLLETTRMYARQYRAHA